MLTRKAMAIMGSIIASWSIADAQAAHAASPVVLELFTSQSCSSCPPADALLKQRAAADPSLVALSYHVDYWDHLSWKDTYSSPANTQRQRAYAQVLGGSVFTPELVVNGTQGMVGSNEEEVSRAITQAKSEMPTFHVSIAPQGNQLAVTIGLVDQTHPEEVPNADILEVRYDRDAKTHVRAGENGGRMLESINNVTSAKRLGALTSQTIASALLIDPPSDGVAILVQAPNQGKILGAAFYSASK